MARMARVVAPGIPHPVIQRGDRRQKGVFSEEDRAYLALMAEWCGRSGVEVRAYCLMAKHGGKIGTVPFSGGWKAQQIEPSDLFSRTYFGLGWVIWQDFRLGWAQFGHSPKRWGGGEEFLPLFFSRVTLACPPIPGCKKKPLTTCPDGIK